MLFGITIAVASAICGVLFFINVRGLHRRNRLLLVLPLLAGLALTSWVGYWLALNGILPDEASWGGPAALWLMATLCTAFGSTFDRHWLPMLVGFSGFAAFVVGAIQVGFV